eukprot:m.47137 g.47137  ORF g.47137 m.47137 type:complete len:120 (+) comp47516_c0_seq6:1315-1674(+)
MFTSQGICSLCLILLFFFFVPRILAFDISQPFVGVNLLEMDQQLAEAFNQSEVELATEIQEVEATASTTASTAASTAASTTESVWRTDVVEGEWSQAAVLHIDFSDLEAELEALSSDQQ